MRNNDQKLLTGNVVDPVDDPSEADRLRDDLRRVTGERDELRKENIRLRQRVNQIDGPAAALRQNLEPLYNALRAIMGDIEVIDPQVEQVNQTAAPSAASNAPPVRSAVWESWKQRLAGAPAKIIEALLLHKDASIEQLVVLTQISRKQTIYDAIHRMNKAGIIDKNGGRYSLKQL